MTKDTVKAALREAVSENERQIRMLAGILDARGWAEGNAGNFSMRLVLSSQPRGEKIELPVRYPELEGRVMLLTTRGSRMRDVARDPLANLILVKIAEGGMEYVVESKSGKVTSEFASHLAAHAVLVKARPGHAVFLHTHPTHVLALSHLAKKPGELRDILVKMNPEAALGLHKNLAVLEFLTPGSEELARATADALARARGVIWSGHGMAATGEDLEAALDIIEVADKAAQLALLMGDHREQCGLSRDQLADIYRAFER